jgi:hypothetical protein
MDTIKYLLGFIIKVVIGLFLVTGLWFFLSVLFPNLEIKKISSTLLGGDWLPAPGSFKGLLGTPKVPSVTDNLYVPALPYDGSKNVYNARGSGGSSAYYVTYTPNGVEVTYNGQTTTGESEVLASAASPTVPTQGASVIPPPSIPASAVTLVNGYASKELYIRNLSIYEGGRVYTGLSFVGEARSSMFIQGRFPIIIADAQGRAVAIATAHATTDWAVPGWVRFQTKITSVLPNKTSCTMVFEQAMVQGTQKQPTRVAIPVLCN